MSELAQFTYHARRRDKKAKPPTIDTIVHFVKRKRTTPSGKRKQMVTLVDKNGYCRGHLKHPSETFLFWEEGGEYIVGRIYSITETSQTNGWIRINGVVTVYTNIIPDPDLPETIDLNKTDTSSEGSIDSSIYWN